MATRIGINGFGRMGRLALRAGWGNPDLAFVHVKEIEVAVTPNLQGRGIGNALTQEAIQLARAFESQDSSCHDHSRQRKGSRLVDTGTTEQRDVSFGRCDGSHDRRNARRVLAELIADASIRRTDDECPRP